MADRWRAQRWYEDSFKGKVTSKCRVESERGSRVGTAWMAVPFTEGGMASDEVTLGAVTFALSVGTLGGHSGR